MTLPDGPYRPNVAILLRNACGQVLVCERANNPGVWQCPQGGIRKKESPEQAVVREVREEIGLPSSAYRIRCHRGPYRYAFPRGIRKGVFIGQEQTWFLADLIGENAPIDLGTRDPEFRDFRWIQPPAFDLARVAPMKRGVYRNVFFDFLGISLTPAR